MYQNRLKQYGTWSEATNGGSEQNQLMQFVQPAVERVAATLTNSVRRQPLAGIAVGLTIGVVLGCLIKRR